MTSLFGQVFSCCFRSRSSESDDDREPIINPDSEAPTYGSLNDVFIDPQRTKERLGVIVRSKEGKMVNVLSAVPFNLRNEPPQAEASSSRSERSQSAHNSDTGDATPEVNGSAAVRRPSPRPSLSTSRSHSTTSLHPGSASYLPPVDDNAQREPILNARLVTRPGLRQVIVRRGRSRGKFGRNGEEMGGHVQARTDCTTSEEVPGEGRVNGSPDATSQSLNQEDRNMPANNDTSLQATFKILDVGSIARGWGD